MTRTRPFHRITVVLATATLAAAGCGHADKGPTAVRAGNELAAHLSAIMADQARAIAWKFAVTSRVENMFPCGKGKEKSADHRDGGVP